MERMDHVESLISDDAYFQPELGWSVKGSLGWTKNCWRAELEDAGSSGL